jgi:hypothetical protein
MAFIHPDFLLATRSARHLYHTCAAGEPIGAACSSCMGIACPQWRPCPASEGSDHLNCYAIFLMTEGGILRKSSESAAIMGGAEQT